MASVRGDMQARSEKKQGYGITFKWLVDPNNFISSRKNWANMKLGLFAIIWMVLVLQGECLHTTIEPKVDFCLYKNVNAGEKLNINYISSGQDENRMMMKVSRRLCYVEVILIGFQFRRPSNQRNYESKRRKCGYRCSGNRRLSGMLENNG